MLITFSYLANSTTTTFPRFLRPAVNPSPECDLWGPLCQTGTIVVAVNLTSTTTSTTVPCSYYLSAQSSSVESASAASYARGPLDYRSSFGYSPECTSYMQAYQNPDLLKPLFSNCPNNASGALLPASSYIPPGVVNVGGHATDEFSCCGDCSMWVDQVRVFYFPEGDQSCSRANGTTTAHADSNMMTSAAKISPVGNNGSVAIVSGYTLYVSQLAISFKGY